MGRAFLEFKDGMSSDLCKSQAKINIFALKYLWKCIAENLAIISQD